MSQSTALLLERLTRILQNDGHIADLKPAQWEALRYISRANRFSRSPGALTAYLGTTKGTVSQTLQALERRGLVEKHAVDQDRRSIRLALTARGADLLSDDPVKELESAIDALPTDARKALRQSLETIVKDLLSRRDGHAFGVCKSCRHFLRKHKEGAPHFCSLLKEPLSADESGKICVEQQAV